MCEIDIGNPKYTTFTKLVQVRNFITFELKVFRHEERERERDTIFLCWLLLHRQLSTNQRAALIAHKVVWSRSALNLDSLVRRQELNSLLFLQSQKSSAHASGAWRHSHPLVTFPICDFILTSVNDASSPHALEHLCSCLHLTKPCTEPKGSHPN